MSAALLGAEAWHRMWTDLGAQAATGGLLNQLVRAYGEPQRHYHTLQHLRECLANFDAASSLARDPAQVQLALWFHDAVYDPLRHDNEERSAAWARDSVQAAGCGEALAGRIADLVLATAGHEAPADDGDAHLLLDVDLAILGASPARFDESSRQVRAEYAHVPEPEFRAGRSRVLAGFLARPRIYRTAPFHDALEQRARDNMARALADLRA